MARGKSDSSPRRGNWTRRNIRPAHPRLGADGDELTAMCDPIVESGATCWIVHSTSNVLLLWKKAIQANGISDD